MAVVVARRQPSTARLQLMLLVQLAAFASATKLEIVTDEEGVMHQRPAAATDQSVQPPAHSPLFDSHENPCFERRCVDQDSFLGPFSPVSNR